MSKQKNVPELRFPEFKNFWSINRLDSLFHISAGGDIDPSNVRTEKDEIYKYPIYANAEKAKGFYAYSNQYKIEKGVITVAGRGVNVGIAHARDHQFYPIVRLLVLKPKLALNIYFFEYLINRINIHIESTGVPQLTAPQISGYKVYFTLLAEQEKIANFLSAVDKKLTQLRRKKELLETYKSGLMQKLFSQQIRFKQDDGRAFPDWQEKKLGELFKWIKTNNLSRENLNYHSGIVQNIHYGDIHTKFKSRFSLKKEKVPYINDLDYVSNLDEESFCKQGDLVIVDASEDYTEIGKTIEIIEVESNKLVAGLHCFLARPKDDFIFVLGYPCYLFQSQIIRDQIRKLAQGISVLGISKSNLEKILIPYPYLEEQQKIADFLTVLDKKIEAVAQQIHHTEQFKKGLLQKMFV